MSQVDQKKQLSISQRRRERERAAMTEQIMDAARVLFVRDGYEAVTINKIAQAIEYSPATIYQYFKDKQALVMAIIQKDQQEIRAQLMVCMQQEDPRERLIEMARRYARWGIEHPNHYQLLLVPPGSWVEQEDKLRQDAPTPLEQEALSLLFEAVKDAIRRGVLKDKFSNAPIVAATLWAGIHGLIMLEITMDEHDRKVIGISDASFEDRFNTMKEVYLGGLLKEYEG